MRKGLNDLVGKTIEHKVFGSCEILEVVDSEQGKFTGKVLKDNEKKKFIFSTQYFINIDEYETVQVQVRKKSAPKRKRPVDLSKYRNHPLVKEIDQKERKTKSIIPDEE